MRLNFNSLLVLKQLWFSLTRFNSSLTFYTFFLMIIKSLSAGMTYLMLLPLLECVGISEQTNTSQPIIWFSTILDFFNLPKTLLAVLCFFSIGMCLTAYMTYLEQKNSTRLQQEYNQWLRSYLQRSLLLANWTFWRSQKKSDLIHGIISETQNLAVCNHQLLLWTNQIFLILVNLCIAFYLSWSFTALIVGVGSLLFFIFYPLHRKILDSGSKHLKANQALQHEINQQLNSIKSIKGSALESIFIEIFENTAFTLKTLAMSLNQSIAKNRFYYTSISVFILSMIIYLALEIFAVPFEKLIVLMIIYSRLWPLVTNTQQVYQRILHQIPAYQHIMQLLKKAEQHQESVVGAEKLKLEEQITVENLSFKYPNSDTWILQQITFQIKKNTSILICGPSGSGKTTLVDIICGLSVPQKGKIWIDENLLTEQNTYSWRKQIAYMTQDTFLFNASVRENLLWFQSSSDEVQLNAALKLAAADFVYQLPNGLDTLLGENGVLLSGGERQRLALARAILQCPKLLIIDEGTNALDSERAAYIQQSLARLKGKLTILIISHQPMNLEAIDQVIRLESTKLYCA